MADYSPKLPKGQATMAESDPVTISSDQSAIPINAPTVEELLTLILTELRINNQHLSLITGQEIREEK